MNNISLPEVGFSGLHLTGAKIDKVTRKIADLKSIFNDADSYNKTSPDKIVYEVESYLPIKEGTAGGLFFGITHIYPGKVGTEYFMTKGHFHKIADRAEFYWGIEGEGMLILMDKNRNTRAEKMYPGSLHYIHGCTAHRTANVGNTALSFGACWPSDAGHDYDIISQYGFSKILVQENGQPELVERK